uniref:Sim22 n=1 Tax=Streptomyces antibioticus TaxID=1890 RepID=Q9AMH0_STRAT|nr:SimX6 [Streptomyces antibioticus]AAL15608.1 Sim22 [Streptomyces antibioticus]
MCGAPGTARRGGRELEAMRRLALLGCTTVTEPDVPVPFDILQRPFADSNAFVRAAAAASKAVAPVVNGAEAVARSVALTVAEAHVSREHSAA